MKNQSGQTLLFVVGLSAVLGVIVMAGTAHFGTSLVNNASFLNQQSTLYFNQGIVNISTQILDQYIATNPPKLLTSGNMTSYLTQQLGSIVQGMPYALPSVNVVSNGTVTTTVPNGPYQGMQVPETNIVLTIQASSKLSPVTTTINAIMSLGDVSPFQFLFFDALPVPAYITPGSDMQLMGLSYFNSDICLGATTTFEIGTVKSAGRIMNYMDTRCNPGTSATPLPAESGTVTIATNPNYTLFAPLTPTNDNGCTSCGGTNQSWKNYAVNEWDNNVVDSSQGMVPLNLVTGTTNGASTQFGYFQAVSGGPFFSNNSTMRFLLDPPLAQDTTAVLSQKFSTQADIRIVDGVWYLNVSGSTWPGVPIWSDHPGSTTDPYGNKVGQDDISAYWAGKGLTWGSQPPELYSYYQYNKGAQKLYDTDGGGSTYGAISYGSLGVNPSPSPTSTLIPAGWVEAVVGNPTPLCFNNPLSCAAPFPAPTPSTFVANNELWPAAPYANGCSGAEFTCPGAGGPSPVPWSTLVLNATRSGFRNYQITEYPDPIGTGYDMILPVNFDLGAFQLALASTQPGELGSYFGGTTSIMGRAFNGIVYITASWPNSNSGYGALNAQGLPPQGYYPLQGANTDPNQAPIFSNIALPSPLASNSVLLSQQALPFPLCSDPSSLAGKPYDSDGTVNRFVVPDCSQYGTNINAYPNVVRVFNGSNLNSLSANGISVVSNLPVFTQGDYNTFSVPSVPLSNPPVPGSPWTPSLVAGDTVTNLSNGWTDANDPWEAPFFYNASLRQATSTTLNTAILYGLAGPMTSYPRPAGSMEDWSNATVTFNGSAVIGFYPVYAMSAWQGDYRVTDVPASRVMTFDPHFAYPNYQPPGTPLFPISSISKWLTK